MLKGKTVLIGVTGGIAAYKIPNLVSSLIKKNCEVHVIMTENATKFITPLVFETLTGNKCIVDTFNRDFEFEVEHISLAKKADILMVAPATANVIGKLAWGIADDMLTTTALACKCPKIISPAMNTNMLENPVVQDNISKLKGYGWTVIEPASGRLACRDVGSGKLPPESVLEEYILKEIAYPKNMEGLKVLVTAGPTQESIDPVRYITNHSSGKMGYELARAAMMRGAQVVLVSGETHLQPPGFVEVINIKSAADMYEAVTANAAEADIVIKAAAVADFTPATVADEKIKKKDSSDMSIPLVRTKDILKTLGEQKREGQFLCGFSMETQNMVENSRAKLTKKNADMIVANNLKVAGAGFGVDTNIVTIITMDSIKQLDIATKEEVAHKILDEIRAAMVRKKDEEPVF